MPYLRGVIDCSSEGCDGIVYVGDTSPYFCNKCGMFYSGEVSPSAWLSLVGFFILSCLMWYFLGKVGVIGAALIAGLGLKSFLRFQFPFFYTASERWNALPSWQQIIFALVMVSLELSVFLFLFAENN